MDSLCRVRNKTLYVFLWRTVSVLTRVLFGCLFPSLLHNSGNIHQNNTPVSAETVRHSSTYIILYLLLVKLNDFRHIFGKRCPKIHYTICFLYWIPVSLEISSELIGSWWHHAPFYQHGLTLIPARMSNHMCSHVWDEITYPFPNFNGFPIEVWEWMSNFIPQFIMDVITYPCWDSR